MPRYRIHRIKEGPSESFRWAAHTGGLAVVKAKDYELGGEVEAATPYAAWKDLRAGANPLRPGDLLERIGTSDEPPTELLIAKYIGFEPAQWFIPELRPPGLPTESNVVLATEPQGATA
jgi:hypothetical protein